MSQDNKIRGQDITINDTFQSPDFSDALDFEFPTTEKGYLLKPESVKLCVYCSEPWSERMEQIYITSGYCETCWGSETVNVIVCDKCNRIVYAK